MNKTKRGAPFRGDVVEPGIHPPTVAPMKIEYWCVRGRPAHPSPFDKLQATGKLGMSGFLMDNNLGKR
ncbi:MAG: hypothetical protein COX57_09670 [Alphaproteobacteria bacterium CG_4_10_14_0_2_um_filter_63_37]|nr:MAG: hypothetical protein COX57_09670 [Alphaproteobacteria bacterium CG_4_10_14_0_2_um_filter_63_37]